MDYDLIVVGAGPAGAACAYTAKANGLRVALVEKHRFPRDKLCGGGLTGRASGLITSIFNEFPPVEMEVRSQIAFHGFGEDLGKSEGAPIRLVMRRAFDAALVQKALDLGVHDFTGKAAQVAQTGVQIGDRTLTAPVIVAADGVNSPTARHVFGTAFDQNEIGFALEIEQPDPDPDAPLRIDFGAAEWGYGWSFPKRHSTTIGVGGVLSRNSDMKLALAGYFETLNVTPGAKVKGQFLPFGAYRKHPGRGTILLAGDAAGLVDPITGEGIAYALQSGYLAAHAVQQALENNAPNSALPRYTAALRPIHRNLSNARVLRNLMFHPKLRPTFLRSFKHSRTLRQDYLRLLGGEIEYPQLLRKTAQRLPRFLWRMVTER